MKLNFIIVCNKAEVIPGKGHNFLGVFDTIYASRFPAIHKEMTIVVSIEKEGDEHQEFFQLKGPNDVIIANPPAINFSGQKPRHQFFHTLENVPLSGEGKYGIDVYIDGKMIGSSYFFAKLTESNAS